LQFKALERFFYPISTWTYENITADIRFKAVVRFANERRSKPRLRALQRLIVVEKEPSRVLVLDSDLFLFTKGVIEGAPLLCPLSER